MIPAPIPQDETVRLAALYASALLGTPDDFALDCVTHIGAQLFRVPICVVSLVDSNRQWFKFCAGLDAAQTPRDIAFCAHVVASGRALVVEDTLRDVRFADNPLVTGPPWIRFYAGYPLRAATGEVLGTLCIIDTQPREFSSPQLKLLPELTTLARAAISTRHTSAAQETLTRELATARRESMIDPLLRSWNRGGIDAIFAQCHKPYLQQGQAFSIMMIDIDHFKRINDSHGHLTGDAVLKTVTREIRSELRSTDDIGRFGGDEMQAAAGPGNAVERVCEAGVH
ncbi:MAG: sensor domain-containing diguanylate cyclase [Betaproteobacteria bacterium]